MISVFIPSRERPELAKQAIDSFKGNKNYEFIIVIDDDDKFVDKYAKLTPNLFITYRYGYERLHNYYNMMCIRADGNWFMLFNDDAILESDPEELSVLVHSHDPKTPLVLNPYSEQDNLFPIISRKLYDIIGHYSLSPHVDSWVQEIGEVTGIQRYIPGVKINHFRDTMSDATYQQSRKAVEVTAPNYNSESMVALRQVDINKVKEYLDENNN